MSVATLENGNLTLTQLIVNNLKYSDVTGYIPSSATLATNASSTGLTINNVFANDEVISPVVALTNSITPSNFVQLTCSSQNGLSVGQSGAVSSGAISCSNVFASTAVNGPTIGISNATTPTNFVQLTCPSQNGLSVGQGSTKGTLTCASILLSANGQTGTLSINSTGQLTWNSNVIA
jgi:hypothetical protein